MNTPELEQRIRSAISDSPQGLWFELQEIAKEGRLVFTHSGVETDQSARVSIAYRPGPGKQLHLELIVTEGMIEYANKGIDDYFYAIVSLLSWLGNLGPELSWAKEFPNDDALVVKEPSGKTWEHRGAWMYYRSG